MLGVPGQVFVSTKVHIERLQIGPVDGPELLRSTLFPEGGIGLRLDPVGIGDRLRLKLHGARPAAGVT